MPWSPNTGEDDTVLPDCKCGHSADSHGDGWCSAFYCDCTMYEQEVEDALQGSQ